MKTGARTDPFEKWIEQTIVAGLEMEGEQLDLATSIRDASKNAYGDVLLNARLVLVGLVARLLHGRSGQPGIVRDDLSHRVTLIAAFLQGIGTTETLISEGQYIKAAGALKQDVEILARLEEVAQGLAKKRKAPDVGKTIPGAKTLYRNLNDVAHPSNVDLLAQLMLRRTVTSEAAGATPLPIFLARTAVELYEIHVWTLLSMVREIMLVLGDLYPGPLRPDDVMVVRSWEALARQLEAAGHVRTNASARENVDR